MSDFDADGICRKCGRGLFTPCACDDIDKSFKRLVKKAIREVKEEEASENHQRAELCVSVLKAFSNEALEAGVLEDMAKFFKGLCMTTELASLMPLVTLIQTKLALRKA